MCRSICSCSQASALWLRPEDSICPLYSGGHWRSRSADTSFDPARVSDSRALDYDPHADLRLHLSRRLLLFVARISWPPAFTWCSLPWSCGCSRCSGRATITCLRCFRFLMVLAAAVLTVGSLFLFSFAFFLLVAVVTFVLMEMRHSVAAEPSARAWILRHPSRHRHGRSPASPTVAHGLRVAGDRARAHADDPGREFSHLLPSSPRFVALS